MSDVFTRGLRAFLLVLIVTLAMASFSHGQDVSRWYLPILQSADDADMGIALSNPALAEVPVTLTARTYAGVVIEGPGIRNPATVKVPASGQWAQRTHEIFGEGIQGKSGWVELESSSPAVKGLFLVFDRRLTYIDGAELAQSPSSRLIFPKVNLTSPISFVNVGSQAVPVAAVSLVDNNGRLVGRNYMRLAPRSGFSGTVLDLVPSLVSFDGYAVVETTGTPFSSRLENLVGFETYLNRSDVAALNAIPDSAQQRTGYIAHFASRGGYTGRLTLINYSFQQQTVKIRAAGLESGGTALSPASATAERTIVAFGRIEEDIERLFGLTGNALITGYVKWETTGNTAGVLGYVDYGTTDGTLLSAGRPRPPRIRICSFRNWPKAAATTRAWRF